MNASSSSKKSEKKTRCCCSLPFLLLYPRLLHRRRVQRVRGTPPRSPRRLDFCSLKIASFLSKRRHLFTEGWFRNAIAFSTLLLPLREVDDDGGEEGEVEEGGGGGALIIGGVMVSLFLSSLASSSSPISFFFQFQRSKKNKFRVSHKVLNPKQFSRKKLYPASGSAP